MSGSGGGGGYGYQADAFAFLSAHALAEQPLNWFDDVEDVPVAVSMETGCPGDDLGETAVLDEVEELQLAAYIMIDAGQAEAAGFGQVPHGGGLIAPLGVGPGGNGKEMLKTLVVGEHEPSERSFGPEARPPLPGGQA